MFNVFGARNQLTDCSLFYVSIEKNFERQNRKKMKWLKTCLKYLLRYLLSRENGGGGRWLNWSGLWRDFVVLIFEERDRKFVLGCHFLQTFFDFLISNLWRKFFYIIQKVLFPKENERQWNKNVESDKLRTAKNWILVANTTRKV